MKKIILSILIIASTLMLVVSVYAQTNNRIDYDSYPFSMMGYGWGLGYGFFGWLMMIVFWALIIAVVVLIVRAVSGQSSRDHKEKTPLDILKERYAKGEIDKEEFEEKKKDLV